MDISENRVAIPPGGCQNKMAKPDFVVVIWQAMLEALSAFKVFV